MKPPAPLKLKRPTQDYYICWWSFSLTEAKKLHKWFGRLVKYLEEKDNEK